MSQGPVVSLHSRCYNFIPNLNIKLFSLCLKKKPPLLSCPQKPSSLLCKQPGIAVGLLCSSVGKEPACNAGDPGLIPGSGRSPGEGIGFPLQYSWASLVAQLVNNPPAMRATLGRSPGEGKGYPLQYSGLENSMDCIVNEVTKSQIRLSDFHFQESLYRIIFFYYYMVFLSIAVSLFI